MGLYDNAYPSVYEEIKRFYPVWYWDVLEMDAIWRAQGAQLDQVRSSIETLLYDQFIATADEATISELEDFFGIEKVFSRTLTDRRRLILAYLSGSDGHCGAAEILTVVRMFTEDSCKLTLTQGGSLGIHINRETDGIFLPSDLYSVLAKKIPAHLRLTTTVTTPLSSDLFVGGAVCEARAEHIPYTVTTPPPASLFIGTAVCESKKEHIPYTLTTPPSADLLVGTAVCEYKKEVIA